MEINKTLLIGGGIAAVAVVGLLLMRNSSGGDEGGSGYYPSTFYAPGTGMVSSSGSTDTQSSTLDAGTAALIALQQTQANNDFIVSKMRIESDERVAFKAEETKKLSTVASLWNSTVQAGIGVKSIKGTVGYVGGEQLAVDYSSDVFKSKDGFLLLPKRK